MPPVITIPSSEERDDSDMPAFKVLNHDDLPDAIIIGEGIFKPFGNDNRKEKPNGIVYPTRRYVGNGAISNLENNHRKTFTKSNGYIYQDNYQTKQQKLKKKYSNSYGNLNHCNSATKRKQENLNLDMNFTKTLDAKLRRLQREERGKHSGQANNTKTHQQQQTQPLQRKPFVTTVKTGQFLRPPPEVATLLGLPIEEEIINRREETRKLYSYASRPRVLNRNPPPQQQQLQQSKQDAHKARCETAAKAAAAIAVQIAGLTFPGAFDHRIVKRDINSNVTASTKRDAPPLPYSNLMYEKRVIRGSNFSQNNVNANKWNPNFCYAKLQSSGIQGGDGESAAARAAESRRRNMARRKAQNQQARAATYRLGSPPAVAGRRHEKIQTELFLEELWNNPPKTDICTQTDLFLDRPASPFYVPACTGQDAETQIYPGDLFDFDMEVQPILEVLVGKTIEQALIEVLEEEELAALREQQRRFMQLRSVDSAEAQRLEERERRMQAEKDRRIAEHQDGLQTQEEMEERIAAAVLTQGYLADMLPSILEGLEDSGFLVDGIKDDVDDSFMPWLMNEVTQEMNAMVGSRDILTDIVREILEERDELYKALYAEPKKSDESEEEEPTLGDLELTEHLKLKAMMSTDEEESPERKTSRTPRKSAK